MKDKEFGIPEQKRFPLDTKDHVMSAIRFFNYADPAYEKELANAIIRKIHEYNITGLTPSSQNRFYKYYNPKDYVEHHGIIGMKWGKKNGPPYPLSGPEHASVTKQASASEKAAAKARGGGEVASLNTENSGKGKKKLSAGQKAAIGAGIAAAAAGTAYGVYRINHRGSSPYLPSTKVLTGIKRDKAIRMGDLKNLRRMSDKDLDSKLARLQKEKQFKDLVKDDVAPGKKAVGDIMGQIGKRLIVAGGAGAGAYAVKAMLQGKFDKKEFAQYVASNPNKKK